MAKESVVNMHKLSMQTTVIVLIMKMMPMKRKVTIVPVMTMIPRNPKVMNRREIQLKEKAKRASFRREIRIKEKANTTTKLSFGKRPPMMRKVNLSTVRVKKIAALTRRVKYWSGKKK